MNGPVKISLTSVVGVPAKLSGPKGSPVSTNLVSKPGIWVPLNTSPPILSLTNGWVNAPPPTWLNLSASMLGYEYFWPSK